MIMIKEDYDEDDEEQILGKRHNLMLSTTIRLRYLQFVSFWIPVSNSISYKNGKTERVMDEHWFPRTFSKTQKNITMRAKSPVRGMTCESNGKLSTPS